MGDLVVFQPGGRRAVWGGKVVEANEPKSGRDEQDKDHEGQGRPLRRASGEMPLSSGGCLLAGSGIGHRQTHPSRRVRALGNIALMASRSPGSMMWSTINPIA